MKNPATRTIGATPSPRFKPWTKSWVAGQFPWKAPRAP